MLIPFTELFSRHNIATTQVIHLGANTGQEADEYARVGMERVFWVEAIPDIYEKLKAHVGKLPGHSALLACLSDVDGQDVTFNIASNGGQSSSFLPFGTHSKEHPTVKFVSKLQMKTIRFDTLMDQFSYLPNGKHGYFLNVDLQGAELKALKGMGFWLKHCSHAYIEVNKAQLYKGCPLVQEIDDYLAQFGFVGMETKWTGAGWGDRYYRNTKWQTS